MGTVVSGQWSVISFAKSALVVAFGLLFFGCQTGPPKRPTVEIAGNKSIEASLFRQHCAICHGNEANGKDINGRAIPSLRYGPAASKTEAEIHDQILNGKLPMPSFRNQLTEDEILKMVKFIRRDLQGKDE